ncbi:hypothetical protein [Comamonas testosteroni]|uniref:Lipoprotein n=1 Tax=Comamonas testosteroni TaxID=285 RepID=A0A8B4S8V6_COMTE|nr:hypothetical protein [Comamonas testosteroni]SUY78948.1 Uncharacterised protein [Comamonas testosteroni]
MKYPRTGWMVAGLMAAVLAGCGGGGSDGGLEGGSSNDGQPQTPNVPEVAAPGVVSPFLGVWKNYPDNYCTANWGVVPASEHSQKGVMPVSYEFTESTMSYTHNIYSDLQCKQLEGSVTLTGKISWAAVTIDGWKSAVRAELTYTGSKATGNIAVDEAEATDEYEDDGKTILGIANNQLFIGDLLTAGPDGYPRRFRSEPAAYR